MPGIAENQNLGPPQITSIVSFSKGFACSCGPGTVAWFEKTDDKEYFKKVSRLNFPPPPKVNAWCQAGMAKPQIHVYLLIIVFYNLLLQMHWDDVLVFPYVIY